MPTDMLLVNPISREIPPAYPPHGLLSIAAVLREKGYGVRLCDRNADKTNFAQVLKRYEPRVVGVSCISGPVVKDATNVSKTVRQAMPETKIVWGGLHPTLFPDQVLREEFVDFLVLGEGEKTVCELLQNIDEPHKYKDIRGVAYKNGKTLQINQLREPIKDLDALPLEAWDLLEIEKYYQDNFYADRVLMLHTSRGCPYRCAYCINPIMHKGSWRGRSASRVIEEIEHLEHRYRIKGVHFFDDNFDANKKRLIEFCKMMKREKIDLAWHHSSRVNYATEDRLALEKSAGCALIEYGVESGSPRILTLIKKDQTISQVIQAFENCKDIGLKANALFMVGLPTETVEDVSATIKLVLSLPFYQALCSIYKPYPGSELFDYCVRTGRLQLPHDLQEYGMLYSFLEEHFNMSEVPSRYLRSVQDFFIKKNVLNLLSTGLRSLNFKLILRQIQTHLEPSNRKIIMRSLLTTLKKPEIMT